MRFFGLSWFFLLSLNACQSAASLNEVRVVEQSRRVRPEWIGTSNSPVTQTAEAIAYQSVKTRVIDLPLGLKQAEAAALNDTRLQLQNEIVLFWKKDKQFLDLDADDRATVTHQLEKLLDTRITAEQIKDIYYEKIFDPNALAALQETFSIHVLVQLKRENLRALLADLRKFCRSSLRQGLIQLAQNEQVFSTQP